MLVGIAACIYGVQSFPCAFQPPKRAEQKLLAKEASSGNLPTNGAKTPDELSSGDALKRAMKDSALEYEAERVCRLLQLPDDLMRDWNQRESCSRRFAVYSLCTMHGNPHRESPYWNVSVHPTEGKIKKGQTVQYVPGPFDR